MKKLYHNGVIRTLCPTCPGQRVEAVLTENAVISAVGSYAALRAAAPDAQAIDLAGQTLLPAFLDAHSHLSAYAMSFLQVPLEGCRSFADIAARVKDFIRDNAVRPGAWVTAKGYDHNALAEKAHPTLALADACAPENPLVLQHASGHVGVMNSLALEKLGITAATPPTEGGRIGLSEGRLTGYLEENAFIANLKKVPMSGMEEMAAAFRKAQQHYASYGITTVQEGMTVSQMLPLYQFLVSQKLLTLDVVAYLVPEDADGFFRAFPGSVGAYQDHFKLGGYKIVLDGSPQGRTAWMRTPYQNETPPYYGYGSMPDEAVRAAVKTAALQNRQLLAHCNGDAAARQLLDAIEAVQAETGAAPVRPVMIHAQLLGVDQLARVKALGVTPSFFVAHVFHWGDIHIENFGPERAARISPAHSALEQGISFTFHQDTPVIEPDMLETVWCAVNRVTKNGVLLGKEERISAEEALQAITIHAARQYGEADKKGSIEPGKAADFVLLDGDPVACAPMDIRQLRVMQTIRDGSVIFRRENGDSC